MISHPTVSFSSRLSLPYVETLIRSRKSGPLSRVSGGGLVAIGEGLLLPPVPAEDKCPVPSVLAANGCIPTSGRVGWGEGLLHVISADEVSLPPDLLGCGDVPLLVPVGRGGIVLSALVGVEEDHLPALNSSGRLKKLKKFSFWKVAGTRERKLVQSWACLGSLHTILSPWLGIRPHKQGYTAPLGHQAPIRHGLAEVPLLNWIMAYTSIPD